MPVHPDNVMAVIDESTITRFLSELRFFSGLSSDSLEKLAGQVTVANYFKSQRILKKGDPGDAMFAIYNGRVAIHEDGHDFGYLGAGECFGEYAMIDNEERSASVTAIEDTVLLRIPHTIFLDLMQSDAGFAKGILSVLIDRHRQLDATHEQLTSSKRETQHANDQLSGLINGAMDAIIMFDRKFRIILANPAAAEILENKEAEQRNVLFFLDEAGAAMIESMVESILSGKSEKKYLPSPVKVIGSTGTETLNEGTLSDYGEPDERFFVLILRNIADRLEAADKIDLLTTQASYLQDELDQATNSHGIIANDPAMMQVLNMVEQVAATDATVLIHGETGTGKELVARAIHQASPRREKPFIRINCGAIPPNLIESELFGHEKGAFTGATSSRKGRFLLADKGTIFLDEIGELPLDLQPKLLRVIQEGEFDPVGSNTTLKVDVRILAATHRDLLALCRDGKFREDLFYRLNVFPIEVPPLRERGNDIVLIAEEMLRRFAKKMDRKIIALSDADRQFFKSYSWPGNVRELQNILERAVIISKGGKVDWQNVLPGPGRGKNNNLPEPEERIYTIDELDELEKQNILKALKKTSWKVSGNNGAAALLNMRPTTLASRIKALDIKRPV